MITESQAKVIRERLISLMNRLDRDREQLKNEALQATGGEASGSLSNVPIHLADLGSHGFEEELTLGFVENEEQIMQEITAAVERLDHGTYGRCESCGKEIPRDRLQTLPYTRFCVDCAQRLERKPVS